MKMRLRNPINAGHSVEERPVAPKIPLFLILVITFGCSGGPGAPLLRTNADDGEGLLIQGCKNVSSAEEVDDYITKFYLSTWNSAAIEGIRAGVTAGTGDLAWLSDP